MKLAIEPRKNNMYPIMAKVSPMRREVSKTRGMPLIRAETRFVSEVDDM
jgi:hypothetical protein